MLPFGKPLNPASLAYLNASVKNLEDANNMLNIAQERYVSPLGRFMNNPLTLLGANIMAASDPNRTGLGGLGAGIAATGQQMAEQNLLQQQIDAQVRAEQQRQIEAQQQQAAREAFAQANPEHRALIEAGHGAELAKQQASAAYDAPKISTAQRIYQEMGGQEGTGKTFPVWYATDYKTGGTTINVGDRRGPVSAGYYETTGPEGETLWKPIPGSPAARPEKSAAEADKQADFALAGLDRLEELVIEHGPEYLPGGVRVP